METKLTIKPKIASLLVACFCGCSATNALIHDPAVLVNDPGILIGRPRFEKNVARVVAIWEPSTGKDVNDRNCRGFAGQILFFGPDCETGVRVNGTVNIYEYDHFDQDSDEPPEPLHTFSFVPAAWEVHRTEGSLGHSYSVFIPYMSKHKEQVNCGLKVEIVLENGRKVSTPTTQVLLHGKQEQAQPGKLSRGFVRENRIVSDVSPKSPGVSTDTPQSAPRKLETLSIPLPRN